MSAHNAVDCYNIKINKKALWITVIAVLLIAVILIGINVMLIRFSEKGKINHIKRAVIENYTFYKVMNGSELPEETLNKHKIVYNEIISLQNELEYRDINKNVMFQIPNNTFRYDDKTYIMTTEEYKMYLDHCSKIALSGLCDLTGTNGYNNADAETKAKLIGDVYEYSKAKAKTKVDPNYKNSKSYKDKCAKISFAEKKSIYPGDYIGFKASLPEKYNEGDAYRIAIENGFDEDEAELLVNLTKYSAEQCERIDKAGGFKYAKVVRKLYSDMTSKGYDCDTLYAPVAKDTFSYKNKKAGIDYEVILTEKQIQTLQNMYIGVYEKAIDTIAERRYRTLNDYYKAVKKCRDNARDASNEAFYYWLQKQN